MYKVIRVTDRNGNESKSAGVAAVGGFVLAATNMEELKALRCLLIYKDEGVHVQTSKIERVEEQTALFGPDTVEVYTRNSIYYLEFSEELSG